MSNKETKSTNGSVILKPTTTKPAPPSAKE